MIIKTRGRKIIRDVLSRKGRTLLVAVSIMIGVFGAVTLISVNDLIIQQRQQVAQRDGLGFADFFEFSYPLWVLGLGLAGMIVIASIASLWPSLSAARRTVSDILRYQ